MLHGCTHADAVSCFVVDLEHDDLTTLVMRDKSIGLDAWTTAGRQADAESLPGSNCCTESLLLIKSHSHVLVTHVTHLGKKAWDVMSSLGHARICLRQAFLAI